jgi:probable O-glycosylation ligase (exosortase A-associated)
MATIPMPTPAAQPPAPVRAGDAVTAPAPALSGTGLPFLLLMLLIVTEFIGFAYYWPPFRSLRIGTAIAYGLVVLVVAKKGVNVFFDRPVAKMLSTFVLFTGATMIWAVVRTYVPVNFRAQLDYLGLFVAVQFLVDRPGRFVAYSVVMSGVALFLVGNNLEKLLSSERTGYFRAGYFMGDGNDFAWGLITILPFALFLVLGKRNFLLRIYGLAAGAAAAFGIVGTQSRGATLAAGGMILFYWLYIARKKALAVIGLVVVIMGALAVAPSTYFERMHSIGDYQDDTSAQGRLHAWGAAIKMATHHPLGVGAGSFNSAYGRYYMPANPGGYAAYRWISAHSVYFKVLGEYGILGVILIVSIIVSAVRLSIRLLREVRASPEAHTTPEYWPGMIALAIVGYAVGATFLGGLAYPFLFMLCGLALSAERLVERDRARATAAAVSVGAPAPRPSTSAAAPPRRPASRPAPRPASGGGGFF